MYTFSDKQLTFVNLNYCIENIFIDGKKCKTYWFLRLIWIQEECLKIHDHYKQFLFIKRVKSRKFQIFLRNL